MPDECSFVASVHVGWVQDQLGADGGGSSGVERNLDVGTLDEIVARHLIVDDVQVVAIAGIHIPTFEQRSAFAFAHVSEAEVFTGAGVALDDGAMTLTGGDQRKKRSRVFERISFLAAAVLDDLRVQSVQEVLVDLVVGLRSRKRGTAATGERGVEDDLVTRVRDELRLVTIFPEVHDGLDELGALVANLRLEVVGTPGVIQTDGVRGFHPLVGTPCQEVNGGGRGAWGRRTVVALAFFRLNGYPTRAARALRTLSDRSGEVETHALREHVFLDEGGYTSTDAHNVINVALDSGGVGDEHWFDIHSRGGGLWVWLSPAPQAHADSSQETVVSFSTGIGGATPTM